MSQLLLPPPTLAVSSAGRAVRQCVLGQATMLVLMVWSLAAALGAPSNALQDRPRVRVRDGHLVFEAALNKNISFQSGGGGILLNGKDLAVVMASVGEASRTLAPSATSDQLQSLADTIAKVEELRERLDQLKTNCDGLRNQLRQTKRNLTRSLQMPVLRLKAAMRRLQNNLRRDACSSNPCGHGGTCVGRYNGYLCLCPAGWQGGRCEEDVDECAHLAGSDLGCQNGATCVNTPGAYRCQCTQGFFGAHCTERQDDCSLASASALCDHGTCIGLPRVAGQPGFRCLCDQGWTTGPGQLSCSQDVDECASGRHFCSKNPPVACLNFPGGFGCGPCPQGYSGDGYSCSDVDECLVNNGGCSQNPRVDCFNTIGSRSCGPCPPGYVGDGVTCTYLGLCNVDNGGCSPLATCIARSGSFRECRCPAGFVGSGVGPNGCVAAARQPGGQQPEQQPFADPCSGQPCRHGFCQAFGNSFQCVCEAGFSGRLCDQAQGGCTSDPCQNNGTCHNDGATGVACTCTPEWTGPLCEEPRQACGGQLYGTNGTLRYPETGEAYTHKRNCIWVLRTTRGKVLNITFSEFHLEDGGSDCGFDFLEIHDGPTPMSRALGRYCGTTLRGKNLASTHDSLFLWFKTDSSVSGIGFALDWTTTDPVCGRDFPVADVGSVSSPGYPDHYPSSRDCMWTVAVPPGKRIQIHLATVQMEHHDNCSYDFLKVYDGASERDQLLGTFCGSGAPGPRPVLTSSHLALLHFHSDDSSTDVGFHATYASVPGVPGCGGVLSRAKGRFTSPSYPSPYENGLLCEWEIRAAPEERLQITFDSFTLEQHSACRWDALEVYDGRDDNAPLLGRFCGSALPPAVLSHGSVLYVRFRTDQSTQLQGFSASYEAVCGGHWTSLRGELSSPRYPEPYPARRLCNYTIELPPGNLVQLDWQHMDIENDGHCAYDYVEVWEPWRNGSERRRGRYCGSVPPDPVTSAYNRLSLRFHSDHSVQHRGFLANYSALDIGCGGVLSEPGRLQSPASESAQSGYRHESHCRWLLQAPPGHTVRLSFSQFALEESTNCSYDYVEIHDSSDERVGRFCGGRAPPTITSTGELLHVLFRTDDSVARDGFLAHFEFLDGRTACGGEFFLSQGVVRSPLFPRHYPADRDCVWLLHVPDGKQIRLNFTHFDLENSTICAFDFLEIRNGAQETSPLAGTFCGREAPVGFVSDSNSLRLRFVSDSSMFGQGFQVFYDSALTGCGGVLTGSSGSLMSPNYPRPYGHNAECRWLIRVSQGSRIALTVVDMDIEEQPDCGYDALEVFDGDSARGERKARLCNLQQRPGHLTSSGSTMFLRFRSDASGAGRGFHVVYTALCSSVIRHQPRGVIESPNFPAPYPSNANCTWTIEALSGHNISLAFSTLEIEHEANCSYDYLEVNETDPDGLTRRLGRFCGEPSTLPPPIVSSQPVVHLHFVTDGSQRLRGFRIEYAWKGCGGTLTKPRGSLQTPNYPHGYPRNTECMWHIKAPLGQRVRLAFVDVNIETASGCPFDYVRVHGGPDLTSPVISEICASSSTPTELMSHGNELTIHFRSDSSIEGKGLRATYRFDTSGACGGVFSTTTALLMSPGYPSNYDAQDDCNWRVIVAPGHVINLQVLDFDMPQSVNCSESYLAVYDDVRDAQPELLRHCGSSLPANVTSAGNRLRIRMKASGFSAGRGFKARYTIGCGATLDADKGGAIATVGYPYFSGDSTCNWIIRTAQTGERVTLTPTHISLPEEHCAQFNVTVRDGDTAEAPLLQTLCSTQVPPSIVSRGGALHVHAYRAVFRATYGAFLSDCGATITSLAGSFASPDYPDSYPRSRDCVWTLSAARGNMMSLSFISWELEDSEFCNKDYVEIREKNAAGRLFGRFCGSSLPGNLSLANGFWIKFHSDDDGVAAGFRAQFETARKVELEGSYGEIESPLYPREDVFVGSFAWIVRVPDGTYPRISWNSLSIYPEDCENRYIQVLDGVEEGSPEAGRYCGHRVPEPLLLRSSGARIRFEPNNAYGRWRMRWEAVNATFIQTLPTVSTGFPCGGRLELANATSTLNLTTPGFPSRYSEGLNCSWTLVAPARRRLRLRVTVLQLRSWDIKESCNYDVISLLDVDPQSSPEQRPLADWCGRVSSRDLPNPVVSSSRFLVARLRTFQSVDDEAMGNGFSAQLTSECGGNLTEGSGQLADTDVLSSEQNCRWLLRSDRRRKLKITLELLEMPSQDGACRDSFLQVLNGAEPESPPLGQGKFCGSSSTFPELPETTSHQATVVYRVRGPFKARFRLRWEEASTSCGGPVALTAESPEATVSSPGNPHGGPAHSVECDWRVQGPPGRRIRVDFPEAFHMPHGCHDQERPKDFVEFLDGGTANAASLGMFCGSERGDSLISSDSLLAVRYVQTGPAGDYLGFRATVSLAECGGTLWPFSAPSRNLQPLREKLLSGAAFDCEWMLRTTDQTNVRLTIQGLELRESPTCTGSDFIEVRDGNKTGELLGRWCGANISADVQSSENSMYLRAKVGSGSPRKSPSLVLRWQYQLQRCGGELTTPEGSFSSPGFPEPVTQRRHCRWNIQAPEGRRISLRFTAGDLSDCTGVVMISEMAHVRNLECGHPLPMEIQSATSRLAVSYTFHRLAGGHGFRASYSTDVELPCWHTLTETSGLLAAPEDALRSGGHLVCQWAVPLLRNQTLALTVDRANATAAGSCQQEYFQLTRRMCRHGDREVMVPDDSATTVYYVKRPQASGQLSAAYRINECGGRLRIADGSVWLTSPGYPSNYPPNSDCLWVVVPEVWGTQVQLNFSSFALEDNCSLDFVEIRTGSNSLSPTLDSYCGVRGPGLLQGPTFSILFHSDGKGSAKGFNVSVSVSGLACGGLVHSRGDRTVTTPNRPAAYPANAECDWTLDVQNGHRARIAFQGRFDLETTADCSADFVQVFEESADGSWTSMGRFCGLHAPQPLVARTHRARVLFRSNGNGRQGDGFEMVVGKACGDVFTEPEGTITSPRFPESYANNLNCSYLIVVPPGDHLELSFDAPTFDLEDSEDCGYDNVTVFSGTLMRDPELVRACGRNAPGNYTLSSSTLVLFRSDWSIGGKGFRLHYRISHCGGNLTGESGRFGLPLEGLPSPGRCRWNIRVAPERVVELRLDMLDVGWGSRVQNCSQDSAATLLRVLDGDADDSPAIYQYCGRSASSPVAKSTGNTMTVLLESFTEYPGGTGFRASYRSSLGPLQGCGGTLHQASGSLSAPKRAGYVGRLDCLWTLVARSGYGLELNVTSLALGNASTPCGDFLEVWDSLDDRHEPMVRLCDRPPALLLSAGNAMLVHLSSAYQDTAFSALFREIPPVCGGTLNVTGWQELRSPGYPAGAPAGLRCLWTLLPTEGTTILMRIDAFSLPCDHSAALTIFESFEGSDTPRPPQRFCGSSAPLEIVQTHSVWGVVRLLLDTGTVPAEAKLVVKFGLDDGHNKTYRLASGVIMNTDYPNWSSVMKPVTITVAPEGLPAGTTLALYFVRFHVGNFINDSCPNTLMQVRDGGPGARVLASVCGDVSPNPVFSTGDRITVTARSSNSNYYVKFLLAYMSSGEGGCGGNLTASEGALSSPGYPQPPKKRVCSWFLAAHKGAVLSLRFQSFSLMGGNCSTNYVDVFSGHRELAEERLTRLCGQDRPAVIESSSERMLVKMSTDEHNDGLGFYARFTSQDVDQRSHVGFVSSASSNL